MEYGITFARDGLATIQRIERDLPWRNDFLRHK